MFAYTKLMQAMAAAGVVSATDPYFNLVTLLLPGNGTNGAQNNTFIDSSTNNFTITRNGNTTQGTFSPFSQTGWSNSLGSTNYITATFSQTFTTSTNFCFEFWGYLNSTPTQDQFWMCGVIPGVFFDAWVDTNRNIQFRNGTSTNSALTTTGTVPIREWAHIALSYDGTTLRCFINGALAGSTTSYTPNASTWTSFQIGFNNYPSGARYWDGYISNYRITIGSAIYTSAFTPSTTPLTSGANTKLLTCQSNRFVDTSNAYPITLTGSPSVQAFSPFAPTAAYSAATVGGSGYFDGNGDYLSIANTANLQFGSGDFTLEFFVYFNALSGNQTIYDKGYTGTNAFVIQTNTNTGTMIVYANGTAIITASSASPVGQWDHYAVVRSGTTITLYRNGVSVGSATNSVNFNNAAVTNIGAGLNQTNSTYTAFANAYISNVRLVKGSAVYTAPFTPPTAPHTAITNTQLLLNFTNGGIIDATGKNVLETVGNAQISTTQSKFGGSSMYFDGTGDYLDAPQSDLYSMRTGNFTLEFWIYFSSTSGTQVIYTGRNTTTPYIQLNSGALQFGFSGGPDNVINYTWNPSATTWYHVAFVRSSGTLSLYINGTSAASASNSTDWATPAYARIAANNSGASAFNGYLDDFRLTKGYARYTSNFTAPTAAFPVQ